MTLRWTARRKAAVLDYLDGRLTSTELLVQHNLTLSDLTSIAPEEIVHWHTLFRQGGRPALRVTRLQQYRKSSYRRRGK